MFIRNKVVLKSMNNKGRTFDFSDILQIINPLSVEKISESVGLRFNFALYFYFLFFRTKNFNIDISKILKENVMFMIVDQVKINYFFLT